MVPLNRRLAGTIIVLGGSVLAGCSSTAPHGAATWCGSADYTCLKNAVFQYRQEADRYSKLAERYRTEADLKAVEFGQHSEEVRTQQDLAQHCDDESEKADALARHFRGELPHNMVH